MLRGNALRVIALWVWLLHYARPEPFTEEPVCLIKPVEGRTELQVSPDGIKLLESITGNVAPVVVIGPYRSGKSFLLNQLLGVPCDKGFGVGHTRETQTKGIWIWGKPVPGNNENGMHVNLLYVDTEGFESTGKANTYDDRIFALSTVLSSLLVYNLPETIRESDIEKLSFAAELAKGFYTRVQGSQGGSLDPGAMLWLIQRDFLRGKSAAQLVAAALAPVPNPHHDADIQQLNRVREGLKAIAANSTGFGLAQPHLERTRLCELPDSQLDPTYVKQREQLKQLVLRLAAPKRVAGRAYTGADLAALVVRLVGALNAQQIPNAASLIQAFNAELQERALKAYLRHMDRLPLPADSEKVEDAHLAGRAAALQVYEEQVLGGEATAELREGLLTKIKREHSIKMTANQAESARVCGEVEIQCERQADAAAGSSLPSLHRFEESLHSCGAAFLRTCRGPAKAEMQERLTKAGEQARRMFEREYNDRLFGGLLVCGIAAVVVFRFLLRVVLVEAAGWVLLAFLEVYPRLYGGSKAMYLSGWWRALVACWEWLIYLFFGFPGAPVLWLGTLLALLWYRRQRARRRKRKSAGDPSGRDLDV